MGGVFALTSFLKVLMAAYPLSLVWTSVYSSLSKKLFNSMVTAGLSSTINTGGLEVIVTSGVHKLHKYSCLIKVNKISTLFMQVTNHRIVFGENCNFRKNSEKRYFNLKYWGFNRFGLKIKLD